MDIDLDTHRPHDGSVTIPRSIMQDMPQHQRLHSPSTPTGLHPHNQPRNPPTAQLPKAGSGPVSVEESSSSGPSSNSAPSYEYQHQQLQHQQQSPSDEKPRGRERDREPEPSSMDITHSNGSGQLSSSAEAPSRKRRRSRKGLDKKFECPHPGCGRTYSRAEHLYRHQLNRRIILSQDFYAISVFEM